MEPAECVVRIEIPIIGKPLVQNEFQTVVTSFRAEGAIVTQRNQSFEMEATTGVADNIRLVTARINNSGILDGFVNVLVCVTNAQDVVPGNLPLSADGEF